MERKKICSVMDCQKLSREACAHAAQNDRLPVQTVVQVLYYEQQRLREAMDVNLTGSESPALLSLKVSHHHPQQKSTTTTTTDVQPVHNEMSYLRKENQDLKLELMKMKMRLKEIEKSADNNHNNSSSSRSVSSSPLGITPHHPSADKPPLPRKSFISSVSKKLGKINPFIRIDGVFPSNTKLRNKPSKDRRHSIS